MTLERQDITEDFYEGDPKDIQFTVRDGLGALKDLATAELTYAIIRDDPRNPTAVLMKSSFLSQIEVAGLGVCIVHLLAPDTIGLHGTFRHQLHVYVADDDAGIVSSGKVSIFRSFARRLRSAHAHAYLSG